MPPLNHRRPRPRAPQERLQKIIAAAGVASRRAAETLIQQGRVTVNGETVRTLGSKADPVVDDIRVDGRRIRTDTAQRYVLLNKPRGYVTTRRDPQRRPTVMDLLRGVRESVYPVGRLDFDSEGLLLLTNDGALAAALTHPRHEVEREYEVRIRGVPDARTLARLERGVLLDGRRTAPAAVSVRHAPRERSASALLRITVREGRNRQIRRMFEAVGHPVQRLARVRIGPLTGTGLPLGRYRDLTSRELTLLRNAVGEP